jgi:hypothetical protein
MRVLASVEVLMDGRDTPEHIVGTLGFVCDVASTFSFFPSCLTVWFGL